MGVLRIMGLCLPMRFDRCQRRTLGQGVDQSSEALQGVTRGAGKERRRGLRDIRTESLIIIVTVSHTLATQCHHQSALARGVWRVTLCLSFHPSISLFHLIPTYTSAVFLTVAVADFFLPFFFFCVCRGDFRHALFITALHHCHRASPVILVPAPGSGMPSFLFQTSPPILSPVQGHSHKVAVNRSKKKKEKNFDIGQEPKAHE